VHTCGSKRPSSRASHEERRDDTKIDTCHSPEVSLRTKVSARKIFEGLAFKSGWMMVIKQNFSRIWDYRLFLINQIHKPAGIKPFSRRPSSARNLAGSLTCRSKSRRCQASR
jgi:hypothetical protein